MIVATLPEYLEIWPRVFSYMLTLGIFGTIIGVLLMSLDMIITRLTPVKRFQWYLSQGVPVFLYNLRGWLTYQVVLILYFVWGAFLLTPIVSFIPIIFFDIRTLIIYWEFLGLIVLFVLYYFRIHRYHKKIAHFTYYWENQCLGIQFYGIDIIIPSQAIVAYSKDYSLHRVAITFKYQLRVVHWERERTYSFQFSSEKTYNDFIDQFILITGIEWKEKSLKSVSKLATLYEPIRFLDLASLSKELPDRTLKILSV